SPPGAATLLWLSCASARNIPGVSRSFARVPENSSVQIEGVRRDTVGFRPNCPQFRMGYRAPFAQVGHSGYAAAALRYVRPLGRSILRSPRVPWNDARVGISFPFARQIPREAN